MSAPAAPVSGFVAVAGEAIERAGAIVWWRLSGATEIDRLAEVFERRGLSEELLPGLVQPATALARALGEHGAKRVLVRPIPGGKALVSEHEAHGDLAYRVELRARLDAFGQVEITPEDHPLGEEIRTGYKRHLGLVTADDVGTWLVRLVARYDGVRLRDTGGVYFVPEPRIAGWNALVEAVHEATDHRINRVPALRADDAVASILDALQTEAERAAAEMEAELAEGEMTARMARHREKRTVAVEAKVARYEAALGARVEGLRERLETLRAGLVAASLKAAEDLDG